MPAAGLLAEPAGESTAGFAVMREETRSFETHLLRGGCVEVFVSPPLWKRKPRGLQHPGTVLPFCLEIASFRKGEVRAEGHTFERMAGDARETRSRGGRRGYRPVRWTSAFQRQQESLPRAGPSHRVLC